MKKELRDLYHLTRYIYWEKEARTVNLKINDFASFGKTLDKAKKVNLHTSKTVRSKWTIGSWGYIEVGKYGYIYYKNDLADYIIYCSNLHDDSKNVGQTAEKGMHITNSRGKSGNLKVLRDMFDKQYGTTLLKAFGTTEEEFKKYIPRQFYYNILENNKTNEVKELKNCSGIDFSSMFPSCACGSLPDSHTAITKHGKVEPTEEYPFCFYNNGTIAIYNEFDGNDWTKHWISDRMFRTKFNNSKDKYLQTPNEAITTTIMMKKSNYELTNIMQELYRIKTENKHNKEAYEDEKFILVAGIGCFHRYKYTRDKYAHLAAVIIARANNKMLNVVKLFDRKDILHICVDGLIYRSNIAIGNDKDILGNIKQEFLDCDMSICGQNCYVVAKDDTVIKYKHGAFNKNKDGSDIDDSTVTSLSSIYNWVKVDNYSEVLKGLGN